MNPILCTGFGYCAEIVPELITRDDWGYPIVKPGDISDDRLLHLARKAVAACPQVALLLEELGHGSDSSRGAIPKSA